jgi:hypothetical protein
MNQAKFLTIVQNGRFQLGEPDQSNGKIFYDSTPDKNHGVEMWIKL